MVDFSRKSNEIWKLRRPTRVRRSRLIDQLATLRHTTVGRRLTETGYARSQLPRAAYLLPPISHRHTHACLRVTCAGDLDERERERRAYHILRARIGELVCHGTYTMSIQFQRSATCSLDRTSNRLAARSPHTCSSDAWTATFCIRNRPGLAGSTGYTYSGNRNKTRGWLEGPSPTSLSPRFPLYTLA